MGGQNVGVHDLMVDTQERKAKSESFIQVMLKELVSSRSPK